MSEKLTPLEIFYEMKHYLSLEWSDLEDLDIVEKSLKALEIIRNKRVDIDWFLTIMEDKKLDDKLWCYNIWNKETYTLTQEEYKLLKEILK